MWTSALFGAKSIRFFEFYGRVEPGRTRGRGQYFAICVDVFYGRPLKTNKIHLHKYIKPLRETKLKMMICYNHSVNKRKYPIWPLDVALSPILHKSYSYSLSSN